MRISLPKRESLPALKQRVSKISDKFAILLLFFGWLVVILLFGPLIRFISHLVPPSQYNLPIFIWASGDNARYILSALSQAQAAIFGIFFTLIFIVTQVQVQNKGASPYDMRQLLKSKQLYIIFFVFIVSITLDLIFLRYAPFDEKISINILGFLALAVIGIMLLLFYMKNIILNTFDGSIVEEIRLGDARYNLRGANLSRAKLSGACLTERNLIEANLVQTDLSRAILIGADLSGADLSEAELSGANLSEAQLGGADLNEANLSGIDLSEANLSGADLRGANLSEADLSEAKRCGADLSKADLRGANLSEANLSGAKLRGAKLGMSNTIGFRTIENLVRVNLVGADLRGANLQEADLSEADLRGADLRGAKIAGTDLRWADLRGADQRGTMEEWDRVI